LSALRRRREPIAGLTTPLPLVAVLPAARRAGRPCERHRHIAHLEFAHGVPYDDPVMRHLGAGLLLAPERPEQINNLFVDIWRWRSAPMLDARLDGEVALADVARTWASAPLCPKTGVVRRDQAEPPLTNIVEEIEAMPSMLTPPAAAGRRGGGADRCGRLQARASRLRPSQPAGFKSQQRSRCGGKFLLA
jgi:hypothetical protein